MGNTTKESRVERSQRIYRYILHQPGNTVVSNLKELSEAVSLKRDTLRSVLKDLVEENLITREDNNKGFKLTVIKFPEVQTGKKEVYTPSPWLQLNKLIKGVLEGDVNYRLYRKQAEELGFTENAYTWYILCRDNPANLHASEVVVNEIHQLANRSAAAKEYFEWLVNKVSCGSYDVYDIKEALERDKEKYSDV